MVLAKDRNLLRAYLVSTVFFSCWLEQLALPCYPWWPHHRVEALSIRWVWVWKQAFHPETSHLSTAVKSSLEHLLCLPPHEECHPTTFLHSLSGDLEHATCHSRSRLAIIVRSKSSLCAKHALWTYAWWELTGWESEDSVAVLTLRKGKEPAQNAFKPVSGLSLMTVPVTLTVHTCMHTYTMWTQMGCILLCPFWASFFLTFGVSYALVSGSTICAIYCPLFGFGICESS